jgi:hypothetical protein
MGGLMFWNKVVRFLKSKGIKGINTNPVSEDPEIRFHLQVISGGHIKGSNIRGCKIHKKHSGEGLS